MKLEQFQALGDRLPPFLRQRLPLLLLSLLVMSMTGVMIRSYIADREREIERQYKQKFQAFVTERTTVVQSTQDIPPDTVLKPNMFEQVEIPLPYRQPYAVTKINELAGKRTTTRIAKGEQIMETKLETLGTGMGLSMRTPAGHRAVTLGQSSFSNIPESVKSGDYVDVMWTFPLPQQGGGTQPVTATLFQQVLVLSVGGTVAGGGEEGSSARGASSGLTLALTPQESELLFFSQALGGRLHLILRPRTDKDIVQVPPASSEMLLNILLPNAAARPAQPAAPAAPRNVEIFRGLQKEVITFPAKEVSASPGIVSIPEKKADGKKGVATTPPLEP